MSKTKIFIQKAVDVHGDKFDYSNVIYNKSTDKVSIICNLCKFSFMTLPHNHLNGRGCKKCQYNNLSQNQPKTKDWFVKEATKIHGDKFDYKDSEYVNHKTSITIYCNQCKSHFKQRAGSHLSGRGCKQCQYDFLPQNQCKDVEIFEYQCSKLHNDKYEYFQDYNGGRKKIKIYCKACKNTFYQSGHAHLLKEQGCPFCYSSKGEDKIASILQDNFIEFERQKTFPDCKSKLSLRFDFYLPSKNICIEYDGELHYYPISYFGGIKHLQETNERDKIKNKYCEQNGIRLIRIPFYERENIEKILINRFLLL